MIRGRLIGLAALVVGAVLVLYTLSADGLSPSFVLLLGVLLILDGLLRLATSRPDQS